jgi:hypothetical protein
MKYIITIQKFDDAGGLIGTMTKTVIENDDTGDMTRNFESPYTIENDDFEEDCDFIMSCEEALVVTVEGLL